MVYCAVCIQLKMFLSSIYVHFIKIYFAAVLKCQMQWKNRIAKTISAVQYI